MRYYFDFRNGDELFADDEGMELLSLELAGEEAARTLIELIELMQASESQQVFSVEVRDENDRQVLEVKYGPADRTALH